MNAKQPDGARRSGVDGSSEAVTSEQLWAKYAARLTSIVVRYLRADYWHMPQVRDKGLGVHISRNPPEQVDELCCPVKQHRSALLHADCWHIPQVQSKQAPAVALRKAFLHITC